MHLHANARSWTTRSRQQQQAPSPEEVRATKKSPSPNMNRRSASVTSVATAKTGGAKRFLPPTPGVVASSNSGNNISSNNNNQSPQQQRRTYFVQQHQQPNVTSPTSPPRITIHTCPHHPHVPATALAANAVVTTCPVCPHFPQGQQQPVQNNSAINYSSKQDEDVAAFPNAQIVPPLEIRSGNADYYYESPQLQRRNNLLPFGVPVWSENSNNNNDVIISGTTKEMMMTKGGDSSRFVTTANGRLQQQQQFIPQAPQIMLSNVVAGSSPTPLTPTMTVMPHILMQHEISKPPIDSRQDELPPAVLSSQQQYNKVIKCKQAAAAVSDLQQTTIISNNVVPRDAPSEQGAGTAPIINSRRNSGLDAKPQFDSSGLILQSQQVTPYTTTTTFLSPVDLTTTMPSGSNKQPYVVQHKRWTQNHISAVITPVQQTPPPLSAINGWRYSPQQEFVDANAVLETAILDDESVTSSTQTTPMVQEPTTNSTLTLTSAGVSNNTGNTLLIVGESTPAGGGDGSPLSLKAASKPIDCNRNVTRGILRHQISVATGMSFHQQLNTAAQTEVPVTDLTQHYVVANNNTQEQGNLCNDAIRDESPDPLVMPNNLYYSQPHAKKMKQNPYANQATIAQQKQLLIPNHHPPAFVPTPPSSSAPATVRTPTLLAEQQRSATGESPRFLNLPSPDGYSGLSGYSSGGSFTTKSNVASANHSDNKRLLKPDNTANSSHFLDDKSLLTKANSASSANGVGCNQEAGTFFRRIWMSPLCSCCNRTAARLQGCSIVIIAATCLVLIIAGCIGILLGVGIGFSSPSSSSADTSNKNKISLPLPATASTIDPTKTYSSSSTASRRPTSTISRLKSRLLEAEAADLEKCGSNMVLCSNGDCRPGGRCDFFTDCSDLSDEQIGCEIGASINSQKRAYSSFQNDGSRKKFLRPKSRISNFDRKLDKSS